MSRRGVVLDDRGVLLWCPLTLYREKTIFTVRPDQVSHSHRRFVSLLRGGFIPSETFHCDQAKSPGIDDFHRLERLSWQPPHRQLAAFCNPLPYWQPADILHRHNQVFMPGATLTRIAFILVRPGRIRLDQRVFLVHG